ncbi:hypothetical protein SKAU_G00393190 [Synaphobranchus kaupii]|uniref:SEA domain-containing protein n=1 Tax=Synaphobranchus kaupii TaxID=118154 RepID=A0A9Q1EC08_SYNKA|nr:hypothetical protein SKAU_G00393190 [Synaphobranchus kaupii]
MAQGLDQEMDLEMDQELDQEIDQKVDQELDQEMDLEKDQELDQEMADLVFNSSSGVPSIDQVVETLENEINNGTVTIPIILSSIFVTSRFHSTTPAAVSTIGVPTTAAATTTTPESAVILLFEFSSDEEFHPELSEPTSQAFRNRVSLTRTQLEPVLRRSFTSFVQLIVFRFRNGSIVTDARAIYRNVGSGPNPDQLITILSQAVESGNVTIPININSISATRPSSSGVSPVSTSVFSCYLLAWCSLLLATMFNLS